MLPREEILGALVDDPDKLMSIVVAKFVYIDKDNDGVISLDELQEVYQMFDPETLAPASRQDREDGRRRQRQRLHRRY